VLRSTRALEDKVHNVTRRLRELTRVELEQRLEHLHSVLVERLRARGLRTARARGGRARSGCGGIACTVNTPRLALLQEDGGCQLVEFGHRRTVGVVGHLRHLRLEVLERLHWPLRRNALQEALFAQ